ncbi:MAG: hypothetical protein FWC15_00660 [Fibromonadales bacterium]|nr:hypothetical protein [Fibromonadales bacterium]
MPPETQRYIDGWKRHMPDYEIIHWNANNFDVSKHKWVEQAVKHKKWAFAADFIRLWAIYNYGGIYLDADVEAVKSFDSLLHLPYFLGIEQSIDEPNIPEMSTFGAEPETAWVKDCMDYYENRDFADENGKLDTTVLPQICKNIFKSKYGILEISDIKSFCKEKAEVQLFSYDYFCPKSFIDELVITQNTYSIHHFASAWRKAKEKQKIQTIIWYKSKFIKFKSWKIFLSIMHPIISLELFLERRRQKAKSKIKD